MAAIKRTERVAGSGDVNGLWPSRPIRLAAAAVLILGSNAAHAVSLQDCKQNQKGYGNAASHELDMPPDLIASIVQIALDGAAQSTDQAGLAETAAYQPVDDPQDRFPWTTHTYSGLQSCFAKVRLAELRASSATEGTTSIEPAPQPPPRPAISAPPDPRGGTSSTAARASSVDLTHCLKAETFGQGKQCGDPTSYSVKVTNVCNATIEAEVCFKRLDGTANCGRESDLAPGKSHDFWGCQLTNTYKYLGCEHWKTRKESCSMMKANGPFIDD